MMNKTLSSFLLVFVFFSAIAQNEKTKKDIITTDSIKSIETVVSEIEQYQPTKIISPISPKKAGIYSAILPGLGQYHNKKYWKIPIVWGAIGAGVGITIYQNNQYKRYRNAFLLELDGQPNEFSTLGLSNLKEALGRQQDTYKRYRDYWIAITTFAYLLNIIDAVVDAHLYEGRKDPDLAIRPVMIYDQYYSQNTYPALQFNLKF